MILSRNVLGLLWAFLLSLGFINVTIPSLFLWGLLLVSFEIPLMWCILKWKMFSIVSAS